MLQHAVFPAHLRAADQLASADGDLIVRRHFKTDWPGGVNRFGALFGFRLNAQFYQPGGQRPADATVTFDYAAGGDVMGVDWRLNIDQAWMDISYRSAIMGNMDPAALFAPLPELKAKVHELLKRTGTRPGHIFNLGHGILPETPVENVKAVVQMVREFKP
jgi:hypothetical protein